MRDPWKWCCGPDGKPDFDKMTEFIEQHDRAGSFDAAGWALFFIWVGISWLADVGWGIGLLGVAAITLGMQALRSVCGVRVEGFWVFIGLGFALAGFWEYFGVQLPLVPFIFIAIGVALLIGRVLLRTSRTNTK